MLNQLLERLAEIESLESQFIILHNRASKVPETPEDLKDLVRLTQFRLDEDRFPTLDLNEVMDGIKGAKQLLTDTSDFFYI